MVRRCIYCDTEKDLSKSDIIPDALTNAKIHGEEKIKAIMMARY